MLEQHQLDAIRNWAQSALDDYYQGIVDGGEPHYPRQAQYVVELVKDYEAVLAHNRLQAALLNKFRITEGEKECQSS